MVRHMFVALFCSTPRQKATKRHVRARPIKVGLRTVRGWQGPQAACCRNQLQRTAWEQLQDRQAQGQVGTACSLVAGWAAACLAQDAASTMGDAVEQRC